MKSFLFVVNTPEFFLSHRVPVADEARRLGYTVHVATSDGAKVDEIIQRGFVHHKIPFSRSGQNPINECKTVFQLWKLFIRIKPNLLHLVTIKPMLYGGVVNRLSVRVPLVAAVSGLGTAFTSTSIFGRIRRFFIKRLYGFALGTTSVKVIFQNPDDKLALLRSGVVREESTFLIRGSGVDLNEYRALSEPNSGKVQVVMAARLLKEKGVYEFYKAAELLDSRGVPVIMKLIGTPDIGNPQSLSKQDFEFWKLKSFIKILGFRSDIADQYAEANIVCLPSYYGEGLPKSLIEAAACGRAIITTDSPGCNYAIEDGVTGILIRPRDHVALADAIQELVFNAKRRNAMGLSGRVFAEQHFDIKVVVEQHMAIYRELLFTNGG